MSTKSGRCLSPERSVEVRQLVAIVFDAERTLIERKEAADQLRQHAAAAFFSLRDREARGDDGVVDDDRGDGVYEWPEGSGG